MCIFIFPFVVITIVTKIEMRYIIRCNDVHAKSNLENLVYNAAASLVDNLFISILVTCYIYRNTNISVFVCPLKFFLTMKRKPVKQNFTNH